MATINDIAQIAKVSKSTVSRVISKQGSVKEQTRVKIEKAMAELNFRPNVFAKGMRTNRSHSIGILYPDLSNPFFSQWYEVFDRMTRTHGYLNYICITDPLGLTEEERIQDVLDRSIDGIIFFSYRKDEAMLEKLSSITRHTPLVCCDSMYDESSLSCVYANGRKGTFDAVCELARSGRKRIAYVKGKEEYQVVKNRFMGYREGLEACGLSYDDLLVYAGDFRLGCGYKAAKQFMGLQHPPDAIMAATDYMAMGVMDYLKKHPVRIPGDVAVFGFDDLNLSQNTSPALSTISLPFSQLAGAAVDTLLTLIENPAHPPIKKIFNCELKNRGSSVQSDNNKK